MCGLTGVIYGKKRRRREEIDHLTWLFTRLLVLSEKRGPHATGAAWLDLDGEHRLFKLPGRRPRGRARMGRDSSTSHELGCVPAR